MLRTSLVSLLALSVFSVAQAQELPPTNPYELAKALRESGQADLALDYLDSLVLKLPPNQQIDLSLERAKARLELANQETDDIKRDSHIAIAKGEFDAFLKKNPTHPRVPEAGISLARVMTLQGKAQLSRAAKGEGDPQKKEESAKARPMFDASAKQYAAAAKKFETLADQTTAPPLKRELTTQLYQAYLDEAINQYYIGDSYYKASDKKDVNDRYNAYKAAQTLFKKLSEKDTKHPLCWVAKAWEGECYIPMSERPKGIKVFDELKAAALKEPFGPIAAGYRQSRFFLIRDQWIEAGSVNTPKAYQDARKLADDWLRDYKTAKFTNEHYAVTYYLAYMLFDEARLGMKKDDKTGAITISDTARNLLVRAEKEFRALTQTNNDYDTRAAKERTTIIRLIVGNATKDVALITNFDECHMTLLVTLDKINQLAKDKPADDDEPKKKEHEKARKALLDRAIALINREKELPVVRESAKDAANSQTTLLWVYRQAGRFYEAAVLGEHMARTSRTPSVVSKAAENSIYAYMEAAGKLDPADTASKMIDFSRAVAMASFLEKAAPDEPSTDEIRFLLARLIIQTKEKSFKEAFQVLGRIRGRSPSLTNARLLQGGLAYELLRPKSPQELPDAQKAAVRNKAIADLSALPIPTRADETAMFVKVKLQLAQLYLTGPASGYATAEKIIVDLLAQIQTLGGLKDEDKLELAMRAETIRIDSVYGQAMPMFLEGKFKETAERLELLIVEIAKAGPALKPDLPAGFSDQATRLDAYRIDRIIVPALNARVKEGAVDKCGALLDMLKQFGGQASKSVSVVYQMVTLAKTQIETLKKDGKKDEADKLSAEILKLVTRIADEKGLTPVMVYNLGKSMKELGEYAKAAELLARIPAPTNPAWLAPGIPKEPEQVGETDSEEVKKKKVEAADKWLADKEVTPIFRAAKLELSRVYRISGKLAEAEALHDELLGKKDPDPLKSRKSGWGARFPDFRKEYFLFCEAKAAAATDPKVAEGLWVEAIRNWDGLAGEYASTITAPIKMPPDTPPPMAAAVRAKLQEQKDELIKRLRPIFYDVVFESVRCTVIANQNLFALKKSSPQIIDTNMAKHGKKIADIETKNPELNNEVRTRYIEFLKTQPAVYGHYKAAGGKDFPMLPPPPDSPPMPGAGGM